MTAFYNEIDPHAAAWLRSLIAAGHIAPGIVDERSIEDILPSELAGFTQCHFFAGIGVWSYALRLAGWPDDRPVWTGSCPCQPFSAAGKGAGFDDERHLWPAWHHLVKERRPPVIFGEQVASADSGPWLDLVQDDLEAVGYAFGAVPFPSAGVGAPHIRDRLYWVANTASARRKWRDGDWVGIDAQLATPQRGGAVGDLAYTSGERFDRQHARLRRPDSRGWNKARHAEADGSREAGFVGNADENPSGGNAGAIQRQEAATSDVRGRSNGFGIKRSIPAVVGAVRGFWSDAEWIACRDDKWRPVEPSTFPLAHGAPARVVRLRGYGNAINAQAARAFIESVM